MTYIAFNQYTMENMSSVWSCFAAKIKQWHFYCFLVLSPQDMCPFVRSQFLRHKNM